VRALRSLESADEEKRRGGAAGVEDVLRRGNAGRERVPGKHGTAPTAYEVVAVLISDQPGELARIFADAGRAGVNIEDVRIEHATGQQAGLVQLMVEPAAARVGEDPGQLAGLVADDEHRDDLVRRGGGAVLAGDALTAGVAAPQHVLDARRAAAPLLLVGGLQGAQCPYGL
ncbi:hypothetical protein ACJA3G_38455, partial [Streptomyces sp. YS-3]